MNILTLIQAITFVAYISFIMIKFKGVLPSISDSWYKLGYPLNKLFTLFCLILGITMLFQGDGVIWFFISGAGLSFVGVATAFKDPDTPTGPIHSIGAGIGIIFALIGIGIVGGLWIPLIGLAIVSVLIKLFRIKNATWWIEKAAFIATITGLLITNL